MEHVYLLSEQPPRPLKNAQKRETLVGVNQECLAHCELVKTRFGEFDYAALNTKFEVKNFTSTFPFLIDNL